MWPILAAFDVGKFAEDFSGMVWTPYLFFLLMGCGIVFSVASKFVQWRIMRHGLSCIRGDYDNPDDVGAINHFQALCAALSATIGLGNIAGVAVAISLGGPGAVFWMWVIGFLGMVLKFFECTLAVMFRDVRDVPDPSAPALMEADAERRTLEYAGQSPPEAGAKSEARGEVRGGPMWYIQKALVDPLKKRNSMWWVLFKALAVLFAISTVLNSFGGGNMFQGWNVADMLEKNFNVNRVGSATVVSILVALVIIGGIKRIGQVASKLVPTMCVIYVLGALYVVSSHAAEIPDYLMLIVKSAFQPVSTQGAFTGVSIWVAFNWGLKRACFSNEAGEGSAAMAHAAAKTDEPIREGVVAGVGPFIDTIIICTMSALVILMSGTWVRPALGTIERIDGDDAYITFAEASTIPSELVAPYLDRLEVDTELLIYVLIPGSNVPQQVSAKITALARGEGDEWAILQAATVDIKGQREAAEIEASEAEADEKPASATWTALQAAGQDVHLSMEGAEMTAFAFDTAVRGFGKYIITLAVCLFAFSTMISWSYYGEKGAEYLLGPGAILPYKFIFVIFVFGGMYMTKFQPVYDFSDATTGLMVLCNLPAVLVLSPVVLRAAKDYFSRLDSGQMPKYRK